MKRVMKKWAIRITTTGILLVGLLIGIVFNPSLLYANQTEIGNYVVYHNSDLNPEIEKRLNNIHNLTKESELYNHSFKIKLCLNDGSFYPELMEKLRGSAFGWGFHNIITLRGISNFKENTVELNGYKWNLEQLVAHEAIHCYQFNKFGIWNSKPIKNHPNWKWEGYPEYVARQNDEQKDLYQNIARLLEFEKEHKNSWSIEFSDGTIAPIDYYKDWLLVKYALEIKEYSYEELLEDKTARSIIEKEMLNWFKGFRKSE